MVSMERRRPHYLLPLLLIVVGVVALLANVVALSADFWDRLFQLWPLLLVVIGIEFLVSGDRVSSARRWLAFGAVLLIAAGATAYAFAGPVTIGGLQSGTSSAPLGQLNSAKLTLAYGGGTVNLSSADLGSDLYRASFSTTGMAPSRSFVVQGDSLTINVNTRFPGAWFGNHDRLDLTLNKAIPWNVEISAGGFSGNLDLRALDLHSLTLSEAAGKLNVQLASPDVMVPIHLSGVAQQLTVSVPSGVPFAVRASGIASNVTLPGGQTMSGAFSDKSWESTGFAGATSGYDIEVSGVADQLNMEVS